jgi:hypothetical protein
MYNKLGFGELKKGGFFIILIFIYVFPTLLYVPPLRFYCVGGCWDRTQDCCDFGIESQTL